MARRNVFTLTLLALALAGGRALAQEAPAPPAPKPPSAKPEAPGSDEPQARSEARAEVGPTLRVQLVISRYQGERKTGSLPYVFTVTPSLESTRLRMGVDTPVPVGPVRAAGKGEDAAPAMPGSYQYRNVGTNIDCRAREVAGRKYRLSLRVENSSGALPAAEKPSELTLGGVPMFRRFELNTEPVLGDGESVQAVASTDPVTGEVVRIDVTLNVLR